MKRAIVGLALVLVGCGVAPAPRDDSAPAPDLDGVAWSYDVTVSDVLSRMDVKLTFRGAPPPRLALGESRGLVALSAPVATWGASTLALPRADDAFATSDVGEDATIAYRIDVDALVGVGAVTRVGSCVCASPGLWLLRPQRLPDDPRAAVRLHLPDGATISTPWPRRADGAYALDETAFRWRGFVAFGRLETHEVDVDGGKLDVAILDRPHAATWPGIERWLVAAARAETTLYGSFPVSRAQVVVKPVSSQRPVAFGETQRGGGPATILYLADDARDDALRDDWVAVHEFAHLGMPAMPAGDAWMSEGFIAYYQEVLRGRGGLLDERATWNELVDEFARAGHADPGAGRTLAEESAAMERAHSQQRVYWAGAAVALLVDVELRRSSGGTRSLDDGMREIRRAFADLPREVSAAEITSHLDAWLGRPVFAEITRPLLASKEFPDVLATLARLGVLEEDGRVTGFDDAAPDAGIRRAILTPAVR